MKRLARDLGVTEQDIRDAVYIALPGSIVAAVAVASLLLFLA